MDICALLITNNFYSETKLVLVLPLHCFCLTPKLLEYSTMSLRCE